MTVQRTKEVGIRKVLAPAQTKLFICFQRIYHTHWNCLCDCYTHSMVFHAQLAAELCYRIIISWWLFAAGGLLLSLLHLQQ